MQAMEIHQVRYFLAVTETRSFTARRSGARSPSRRSPPPSRSWRRRLGRPLVLRERGGAKLTPLGQHVLPRFQRLQDETQAVQVIAENHRRLKQVPLRVGVLCSSGRRGSRDRSPRSAPRPRAWSWRWPWPRRARSCAGWRRPRSTSSSRTSARSCPEWCVVAPLYEERYVVVLPPGHRLAAREALRLEDLDGEPYLDRLACEMRERVKGAYAARGIELYAAYRTDAGGLGAEPGAGRAGLRLHAGALAAPRRGDAPPARRPRP